MKRSWTSRTVDEQEQMRSWISKGKPCVSFALVPLEQVEGEDKSVDISVPLIFLDSSKALGLGCSAKKHEFLRLFCEHCKFWDDSGRARLLVSRLYFWVGGFGIRWHYLLDGMGANRAEFESRPVLSWWQKSDGEVLREILRTVVYGDVLWTALLIRPY